MPVSVSRIVQAVVVLSVITMTAEIVQAQPAQPSLVAAQESGSYTFTWARVPGATWYYLWVNELVGSSGTPRVQTWYTADETRCAGAQTNCTIAVAIPRMAFGTHAWWIQAWSPAGYSPWSAQGNMMARPPMPPIVTDANGTYIGSLLTDNALLMEVNGLPAKVNFLQTGFKSDGVDRFFLLGGCAGQAYTYASSVDAVYFPTNVSNGYLVRGAALTATTVSFSNISPGGTAGTCTAYAISIPLMPVNPIDLSSQLGSLAPNFKVVR